MPSTCSVAVCACSISVFLFCFLYSSKVYWQRPGPGKGGWIPTGVGISSSDCRAVLGWLSETKFFLPSWHGGEVGKRVPWTSVAEDPASSSWVSTQPLRKVLTVLTSTHPQDPQEVLALDRCCSYLFVKETKAL